MLNGRVAGAVGWAVASGALMFAGFGCAPASDEVTPRRQPGATMTMYEPEQHELYDGHFVMAARRIYMVGGLADAPGWDHLGNDGASTTAVAGAAELDVDEIRNTGTFEAHLQIPDGDLVLVMDRFHEFSPCQHGGIAAFLYEHGDSGCGDTNWPKTFGYLAGWGYGRATLNSQLLYSDYEMHFMVTQGIRHRETLAVNYPMPGKRSAAGEVNPATQQMDFYIRSPEANQANTPARDVFLHFFAMEVTWR